MLGWEEGLLYVAVAAGYLTSRRWAPPKQLETASRLTVLLLVGALGMVLEGAGPISPAGVLLPSVALALGLVGSSILFAYLLGGRPASGAPDSEGSSKGPTPPGGRWHALLFPGVILVALLFGYVVASFGRPPGAWGNDLIEVFLLLLLFQVGWEIRLSRAALRALPIPLGAAALSAVAVAVPAALLMGIPLRTSFAIVGAFGWYTLAGPLVSQSAGPTLGLVAFLANFLRENFTMVSAPAVGRRAGAEAMTAAGGATAMDTTLFFVTTYGRRDAGGLALASGTVLTLLVPLLLGLLLGPG